MLRLEANLTGQRQRLRVHGIVLAGLIEKRVENLSVRPNPDADLRGTQRGTVDRRQWRRLDDRAIFQRTEDADHRLVDRHATFGSLDVVRLFRERRRFLCGARTAASTGVGSNRERGSMGGGKKGRLLHSNPDCVARPLFFGATLRWKIRARWEASSGSGRTCRR